jgi:hypothetical protein
VLLDSSISFSFAYPALAHPRILDRHGRKARAALFSQVSETFSASAALSCTTFHNEFSLNNSLMMFGIAVGDEMSDG